MFLFRHINFKNIATEKAMQLPGGKTMVSQVSALLTELIWKMAQEKRVWANDSQLHCIIESPGKGLKPEAQSVSLNN